MSNNKHHFFVDGKKFETDRTALKGIEIKQMAAIDVTFQLFLEARGQDPDSQVSDGQDVILDTPPKQFYSVPPATFGKS
jgi:hypothetical protein